MVQDNLCLVHSIKPNIILPQGLLQLYNFSSYCSSFWTLDTCDTEHRNNSVLLSEYVYFSFSYGLCKVSVINTVNTVNT